jgi:hypothetical protein
VWERRGSVSTDTSVATVRRIGDGDAVGERRPSVSSSSSVATAFRVEVVGERRLSTCTDTSVATAFRVEDEDAVAETRPSVSSSTSPAGEQQRTQAREEDPIMRITAQLLAQRREDSATPTSAPDQETEQRPPSVPPYLETPIASPGARQSRHEGRVALGLALVLVRDRVDDERWLEGIDQMRERGEDVRALHEIISLGMQARTGVRDL